MNKVKLPLRQAQGLADRIVAELAPSCERVEVAGSIRRLQSLVGDVELVAVPRYSLNLLGQPDRSLLWDAVDELVRVGRLTRGNAWGPRLRRCGVPGLEGLNLELHAVTAETWGVLLAINTGSTDFNRRLVVPRRFGGYLDDGLALHDGRVWRDDDLDREVLECPRRRVTVSVEPKPGAVPLATPEEQDFLELAGGWLHPAFRDVPDASSVSHLAAAGGVR